MKILFYVLIQSFIYRFKKSGYLNIKHHKLRE
jgi:hypothetical protein